MRTHTHIHTSHPHTHTLHTHTHTQRVRHPPPPPARPPQWCEDHIASLPASRGVHPFYDDFTTPCYDGEHNVILGGSFVSTGDEASVFARFHFRPHFFQHAGERRARVAGRRGRLPQRGSGAGVSLGAGCLPCPPRPNATLPRRCHAPPHAAPAFHIARHPRPAEPSSPHRPTTLLISCLLCRQATWLSSAGFRLVTLNHSNLILINF